jgi:hypothetical protein
MNSDCIYSLQTIITNNISILVQRLNLPCMLRIIFSQDVVLYKFRKFYDSMMTIFHKYACKTLHELPLSITDDQMYEILIQSNLMTTTDKKIVVRMIRDSTRSWEIVGRCEAIEGSLYYVSPDEFTFPEFFEGVARAGVRKYSAIGAPKGVVESKQQVHDREDSHNDHNIDYMLQGLKDVVKAIH